MTKILISGITGFVGTNLEKYLLSYLPDIEISGITRSIAYNNSVNMSDLDSTNGYDVVIHLAGKAHDFKKVSKPEEYYEVNTMLTKKLYDLFILSDSKKFIFISSVKAVKDSVDEILTEDNIPNPQTHYGKSKLLAEQYIQEQDLPNEKSYYILRPCMIHGRGNKGNLNLLYQFVNKGIPYPLGAFKNQRSFLSVDNLCFIVKELIQQPINSGIYNVSDDESISTTELVSIISNACNKKTKIWNLPIILILSMGKIGDFFKLPFDTEKLNKLTENYQVSNQKIKLAINKELPLSARQGLEQTTNSFIG